MASTSDVIVVASGLQQYDEEALNNVRLFHFEIC